MRPGAGRLVRPGQQPPVAALAQLLQCRPGLAADGGERALDLVGDDQGLAVVQVAGVEIEQAVLDLVVASKPNKIIADILGISIKTVELHRANMMSKLGVRSLPELMKVALGHG